MNPHPSDHRAIGLVAALLLRSVFVGLALAIVWAPWQHAAAQEPAAPLADHSPLSAEQVAHNLAEMNLRRAQALQAYRGTRVYHVEYHGFPGTRVAEMVVDVTYRSPATKEFSIQSATGSKLILDKVLKKLLEAEKEALGAEVQRHSALSNENYRFSLAGYEEGPSGPVYVLEVEPRTKDKFLYRGKIWVDAEDFAVVRLEAGPARSPSFWTKNSEIQQVYKKVCDFWLPARNHSVTAIRLGGHAELTIDYKDYEITDAGPVRRLSMLPATPSVVAVRVRE